jgi:hypothetical protein
MASATRLQTLTPVEEGGDATGDGGDVLDNKNAKDTQAGAFDGLPEPKFKTTQLTVRTTWSAPIADIDNLLQVRNTTGGIERLASSPATEDANLAQRTFTGLRHTGDNTGSPGGGQETIVSTRGAVVGDYTLDVLILPETGLNPVTYDVEVYDNGSLIYEARGQQVNPGAPQQHQFTVTENGGHD